MISALLNFLYPTRCPECSVPSDNFKTAPFCRACWEGIRAFQGSSCRICSLPFSSGFASQCGDCLRNPPLFSRAVSFGIYEGTLAAAINLFKFHKLKRLSRPLGNLLLGIDIPADVVVPVPLSAPGLRERGFNQSLLIARTYSRRKKIPLGIDGLRKIRETKPQVGLTAKERAANLRGAYRATGTFGGLRVLLIDDVMTTGATANECARELLRAGAAEVLVLTLARASAL